MSTVRMGAGFSNGACRWPRSSDTLNCSVRTRDPDAAPKAPSPRQPKPRLFESNGNKRQAGVNVVGYVRAENGVGEVARLLVATLQEAGIPHTVLSWTRPSVGKSIRFH